MVQWLLIFNVFLWGVALPAWAFIIITEIKINRSQRMTVPAAGGTFVGLGAMTMANRPLAPGWQFADPGEIEVFAGLMPITAEAEQTARELLMDWLTPIQRAQYTEFGYFICKGNHTGRIYLVREADRFFNVEADWGDQKHWLCFVPQGAMPSGDKMLAQKIMLENDEQHVLQIANVREIPYMSGLDTLRQTNAQSYAQMVTATWASTAGVGLNQIVTQNSTQWPG
jgi:hypothetical protein